MFEECSLRSSIRDLRKSVRDEEIKQSRLNNEFLNKVMSQVFGHKTTENSYEEEIKVSIMDAESYEAKLDHVSDVFLSNKVYSSNTHTSNSVKLINVDREMNHDPMMDQLIELIKAMTILPDDNCKQPDILEKYFSNLTIENNYKTGLSTQQEAHFTKSDTNDGKAINQELKQIDLSDFLQKSDNIENFAEFAPEEWMLTLKPNKSRGILIVVPGRAIVLASGGFRKVIDASVIAKYLHKDTVLGSIFDVFVSHTDYQVSIDIFDVLLLEGKPMFEQPAEIRYYFLYSKFFTNNSINRLPVPGMSSPFEPFMNTVCVVEEKTLEINLVCLHSCSSASVIRVKNNKPMFHDGSMFLINRRGEYKINQTSEDLILFKDLHNSLSLGKNQVLPLKFDINSTTFLDTADAYKISVDSKNLIEEWSFTEDETEFPAKLPNTTSIQQPHIAMHKKVYWQNTKTKALIRLKNSHMYSVGIVNTSSVFETGSHRCSMQLKDGSRDTVNLHVFGEYGCLTSPSTPATVDDLLACLLKRNC